MPLCWAQWTGYIVAVCASTFCHRVPNCRKTLLEGSTSWLGHWCMIFGADFKCRVQKSGLCAKQWVGLFRTDLTVKGNTSLHSVCDIFQVSMHTLIQVIRTTKCMFSIGMVATMSVEGKVFS